MPRFIQMNGESNDDDDGGMRRVDIVNSSTSATKSKVIYLFIHTIIALQLLGPGFVLAFSVSISKHFFINEYQKPVLPEPELDHSSFNSSSNDTDSYEDYEVTHNLPDKDDEKFFMSIFYVSTCLGGFIAYWLYGLLGNAISLIISNLIAIGGWAMLALAPNHAVVFFGRFLTGFNLGMTPLICYMYLNEITTKNDKQYIFSWIFPSIATGILLKYIFVHLVTPHIIAILFIIPLIVASLMVFLLPLSPVWCIKKGKVVKAEEALIRLRNGGGPAVKDELERLFEKYGRGNQLSPTFRTSLTLMNTKQFKSNLLKMMGLMALQQFSGVYQNMFFVREAISEFILLEIHKNMFIPLTYGIITLYVTILFTHITLRHWERKRLMLLSTLCITVGIILIAILLVIMTEFYRSITSIVVAFLPIAIVTIYSSFYGLGIMTVPWMLFADIFPKEIRVYGNGICFIWSSLCGFMVTFFGFHHQLFIPLLMAITTLFGPVYVYHCFPIVPIDPDDSNEICNVSSSINTSSTTEPHDNEERINLVT